MIRFSPPRLHTCSCTKKWELVYDRTGRNGEVIEFMCILLIYVPTKERMHSTQQGILSVDIHADPKISSTA